MARDPGCNSPVPMNIVLVANKLFSGLFEKVTVKFFDRREKKQNKAAVAAASACTMFTISLMCFIAIAALVPPTAAMPVGNDNTASLANTATNNTAIALNSTAAIPANIRFTRQIAAHTQSCKCHQDLFNWQWKLHIGELYDDGWHCDPLYEAVVKATNAPWTMSWSCNNDGNGDISVSFTVFGDKLDADVLNEDLSKVFTEVNGFNCPDH